VQAPTLLALSLLVTLSPPLAAATALERQFELIVDVDAEQRWQRSDKKYGEQWSKSTTQQRYEILTRLRADPELQVRNLLDPDLDTRLEAKTIHLARSAKKMLDASGKPIRIPATPQEQAALMRRMQLDQVACKAAPACEFGVNLQYAAIFAAMQYPEALEEDTVPGRYLYFLRYPGCPSRARVTLTMNIEGVRYNKTVDKLVPFSEQRSADTLDNFEELLLCSHYTAVIDTADPQRPLYLENVHIPRPLGETVYTERGGTVRRNESQPMPSAVLEWVSANLQHAATAGSISGEVPLVLPLNGNSTILGTSTGIAKVKMSWRFSEPGTPPAR
jgi:hypothetical protein